MITINLFEKEKSAIHLQEGCYDMYLSGGYQISIDARFGVVIRDAVSRESISMKPAVKYRHKLNGIRAVRIYRMDVPKSGTYEVILLNPEAVAVKRSRLLFANLLSSVPTDKSQINVMIERCF